MIQRYRTRLLIALMLVAILAIFTTSFMMFHRVESQFNQYLDSNRMDAVRMMEATLIDHHNQRNEFEVNELRSLFHQQAMTHDFNLELYDTSGEEVISSDQSGHMMGHHHNEDHYDESITIPLEDGSSGIGQLVINYSNQYVGAADAFMEDIRTQAIWAVMLTTLAALLMSVLMSNHLIAKVKKITQAVKNINHSTDYQMLELSQFDVELKPLAEAYNHLNSTLKEEDELRKQFTADLAHELRTPLSTLRSQIEAYQDGVWEPTESRLERTYNEIMRLVRLVNDLEKLIIAENPQIELKEENVSANELLQQTIIQFQNVFRQKNVGLHGYSDSSEPVFKGDTDRVMQILSNLLNNALMYTPAHKNVYLHVKRLDRWVQFVIQDEGCGMNPSQIPHLFERFYRGDDSRNRSSGGLGIGLSIVKALVTAHNGTVEIESEEKKGTTVYVYFPLN